MRCTTMFASAVTPVLCAACMLCAALPAQAVIQVFNDGGVHTVNTNIAPDSIEVRGTTTVNVDAGANLGATGGSSVSTFDSAVYNMSGGVLTDELFMFNNSTATIIGGQIVDDITTNDNVVANISSVTVDDDLETFGSSVLNVSGGSFNEDVESSDNSTVHISGGTFQTGSDGANIEAGGNSVINISGGAFGSGETDGAGYIGAIENGTINIFGGDISGQPEGLVTEAGGKINVYDFDGGQPAAINTAAGGRISFFGGPLTSLVANDPGVRLIGTDGSLASIIAEDSSEITIYGSGFKWSGVVNLPYGPLSFASGSLSGVLSNGTPFSVSFNRNLLAGGTRGAIVLAPPIPEPGAMALTLLALVGTGLFRRQRVH